MVDLKSHAIPGAVEIGPGVNRFPRVHVTTPWSQADIYLYGAQVTSFQKQGKPPLLFLSESSRFTEGKAIRGGIPICFPWFGPRTGDVAHGFARITEWQLEKTQQLSGGQVVVRLRLPILKRPEPWPPFLAELVVTVGESLTLELQLTNQSRDQLFRFENCLHTYFTVGDINKISIHGLEGVRYLDKMQNPSPEKQSADPIRIVAQTDRTYLHTTEAVEIRDPVLNRTIRVDKKGSASTVVWNPWTTQVLADFGPDEFRRMVCVESGNVERNALSLPPGSTTVLEVTLSSRD